MRRCGCAVTLSEPECRGRPSRLIRSEQLNNGMMDERKKGETPKQVNPSLDTPAVADTALLID